MKFYILLTLKLESEKEHLRGDMEDALRKREWREQDDINTTWVLETPVYIHENLADAEKAALRKAEKTVSEAFSEAKVTGNVIAMIQAGINKPVVI